MKKNKKKKRNTEGGYKRICLNCSLRYNCAIRKKSIINQFKEHCKLFEPDYDRVYHRNSEINVRKIHNKLYDIANYLKHYGEDDTNKDNKEDK